MCAPPPLSADEGGGKLSLQPNFQKGDGLSRTLTFKRACWEREGVTFFRGRGSNFHIKDKLKSEIFNGKKNLYAKIFFSVITKNSNWEILPKNLVTFKR